MILKTIIGAAIGGGLGYLYATKVGCKSGTCPITSNKSASTIYGALLGAILANSF